MASATDNSFHGLDEEATCSICLEYFQDPVVTECGHNFCRACLFKCWEGSEGEEIICPQCREKVRRKLIPNRPLANLAEKLKHLEEKKAKEGKGVCEKHQEPLKFFCKDDEVPICVVCDKSKEHRDHDVVPLEEAAQDYQDQVQRSLEFLAKERTEILAYKAETEDKSQKILNQAQAEMEKAKEQLRELHSFLNEEEKLLAAQMEEVEKDVAKERDDHLARLSEELSSLEGLIQEMEDKCRQPPGELLQDIRNFLQSHEKKETHLNPVILSSELKGKFWDAHDRNILSVKKMKQFRDNWIPGPQLQANVTLDPDTAFPCLVLSENRKSVNYENKHQDLPDNPKRFAKRAYVLGHEGFTGGRHCWEVTEGKEGDWAVGVARNSIRRKDAINVSTKEGMWVIRKLVVKGRKTQYMTSNHSDQSLLPLSGNLRKVRITLNCEDGEVAFYDGDTGSHLYTFSGVSFSGETLFPFFYVVKHASLTISPQGGLISLSEKPALN